MVFEADAARIIARHARIHADCAAGTIHEKQTDQRAFGEVAISWPECTATTFGNILQPGTPGLAIVHDDQFGGVGHAPELALVVPGLLLVHSDRVLPPSTGRLIPFI